MLDEREDETFAWRLQTRPFELRRPANYSRYRLEFTDADGVVRLAEVELLTDRSLPTSPLSADVGGTAGWAGESAVVPVTVTGRGG
ncbi:MAG: hypothetical protein ACRD2C_10670 [Acidimicrobiales bacterium]